MARHWEDREQIKAGIGSAGWMGHVCWFLGCIFAVLGLIGDAVNATLGLEPMTWLLLAIVAFVASIPLFIGWAVAWYLRSIEATSQNKRGESSIGSS